MKAQVSFLSVLTVLIFTLFSSSASFADDEAPKTPIEQFQEVVRKGDVLLIQDFLKRNHIDVNEKIYSGKDKERHTTTLISMSGTFPDFWSPGKLKIAKYLIESHKADVNAADDNGNTSLIYACGMGHTDLVKLLVESGADSDTPNTHGVRPIFAAARNGRLEILKYFLEDLKLDIKQKDEERLSIFVNVIHSTSLPTVKYLVEKQGIVPNTGDIQSATQQVEESQKDIETKYASFNSFEEKKKLDPRLTAEQFCAGKDLGEFGESLCKSLKNAKLVLEYLKTK